MQARHLSSILWTHGMTQSFDGCLLGGGDCSVGAAHMTGSGPGSCKSEQKSKY